jgi:hypothetical protein
MSNIEISADFSPQKLKAYSRNEVIASITVKNLSDVNTYWCECDVNVTPPLTLSHDSELSLGRIRIGILKPKGIIRKQVKVYTRPNNYPDEYKISVVSFIYEEDGTISERGEHRMLIPCTDNAVRNVEK